MDEALLKLLADQTLALQELTKIVVANKLDGDAIHANNAQRSMDLLANSLTDYMHEPQSKFTFTTWYDRHEDVFLVDAKNLDDAAKVRLLLRKLDDKSHSTYVNFILPKKTSQNSFEDTVKILKKMFGEPESLFSVRYNCMKLVKKSSDDFIAFASIVNKECERFEFANLTSDQFKCLIFICGLTSCEKEFRTRLLMKVESEAALTLDTLTVECKRLMDLKSNAELIVKNTPSSSAPQVKQIFDKNKKKSAKPVEQSNSHRINNQNSTKKVPYRPCWLCGEKHFVKECTYTKHLCRDCNKTGHKEGFCNYAQPKKQNSSQTNSSDKRTKVIAVSKVDFAAKRKFIVIHINGTPIRLQVDTASDVTIISRDNYVLLGQPPAVECIEYAQNASGDPLSLQLEFDSSSFNNVDTAGVCYVTDVPDLNVIGNDWLDLFGLFDVPLNAVCSQITKTSNPVNTHDFMVNFKQRFSSVFSSTLGKCTKTQVTLRLKPEAQPVFRPKRPVAYAAVPIVDAELDRLQEMDVLSPISYSEWAAPIVTTKKPNGSIRLCADFATGLNDALETYHYPLPTPDSIFATLNGGKYYSKIDFADAYFQLVVDESSKKYITINTHRGLFQFNRLPFGVKVASAVFQQIIDAMIAGLDRTCGYQDDITVNGRTIEEHNRNLIALFERIKEWGFNIRHHKCKFMMTEIEFLGFIIDEHGRRPNTAKVQAIVDMPEPHDVTTVKSFLGMINYYSKFVKEMKDLRFPLDRLLCKDVKFEWTDECREAFNKAKEILLSDLLLAHYDPNVPIRVAADASIHGLGAVIFHRYNDGSEKAIEHASRSLSPAEKNYGQIEKEALSLVFAVQKFHKMIWGRKFVLETDHKPLLAVFGAKKGIPVHSSSRLQRWAISLMSYDFVVEHKNTENFGHADALSRLIANHQSPLEPIIISSIRILEDSINRILVDAIRVLPVTAEMIAHATKNDELLASVSTYLKSTWPSHIDNDVLKIFYNRRESLCELDDCLLFNDRVVIPLSLQNEILQQLHVAHPGIVRMKALARSYVYWPNIDKDITEYVQRCSRCASTAKTPVKATLSSWPKSSHVWSRVHIDFAGEFQGHYYFVIVDSYSKWPEIFIMNNITSAAAISKLQELNARFGNMSILVSDNGPAFISVEFDEFFKWSGRTICRYIQAGTQKSKREERVPDVLQTFLQRYRMTPNAQLPNNCSPAEVMFGRKMNSVLDLVKPRLKFDVIRDVKMEDQFNTKHGAKHRIFYPNQKIYVRDFRERKIVWSPAVIIERVGNVVYNVECDGIIWRRHANQIRVRYEYEDEQSDPVLSLLYDVFETTPLPVIIQQPEVSQSTPQPNETFSTIPTIPARPQRDRRQVVRTDFSRCVKGRYLDL
ncbi:uncharacterized protein K02A2.6-like [Bradysia coprophila]|uniref:uncharacterized protein K02A2.6-like n=1 Tax=Bradysia coprophila TaxID=38358 RepID=UPI00187D74E7|nr:uncharacterized protein K02A2.6-like [Bradysia coprophila]